MDRIVSRKKSSPTQLNNGAKAIMPQSALPFQYQAEKTDSGLTGFAGLPLYTRNLSKCLHCTKKGIKLWGRKDYT